MNNRCLVYITLPLLFCAPLRAAEGSDDMGEISLEGLMNLKVTIASGAKGMTLRESPGIVTLITREEIENSGARDLLDILSLVPGLSFGVDVQGVVGIIARGNWAHEGKISLMIDNMEMNDLAFATLQFGGHFSVDNIERIEIIRGPGSAIYGGFAELGVIKIITKTAQNIKLADGAVLAGQMNDGAQRKAASLAKAKKFDNGEFDANMYYSQSVRSDRTFSDFYGNSYDMKDNSDIESYMLNTSFNYGGFASRLLIDQYNLMQRDIFFVAAPYAVEENFGSKFLDFKYDFKLSDKLTLSPSVNIKQQSPWESNSQKARALEEADPDSFGGQVFHEKLQRITIKPAVASYDFGDANNLITGVSYYEDKVLSGSNYAGPEPKPEQKYTSEAAFGQALIATGIGNITAGARYEKHSVAGSTFLPRVGYTKVWNSAHLKVLWSKAFRAPVDQNIIAFTDRSGSGGNIKPEKTTVFEIETGYQVNSNFFLIANIYDIKIKDPIVYFYITDDAYTNYSKVGTRGLEVEARYKDNWGYVNLGYSYYQVGNNKVDQYAVRGTVDNPDEDPINVINDKQLVGAPANKFTLNSSFKLGSNWTVNPSLIYESSKYGYTSVTPDDSEQLVASKLDAVTRININLVRKNFVTKNMDLSFAVYNLLNEKIEYVEPYYDGYHAPLPGPSREVLLKLKFSY